MIELPPRNSFVLPFAPPGSQLGDTNAFREEAKYDHVPNCVSAGNLGDTTTLADPAVVADLVANRIG